MVARRASATYAFIAAGLALLPIAGCSGGYWSKEGLFGSLASPWITITLLVPLILFVQARALNIPLGRATAGFVADVGLAFLWLAGLSILEMIATGDGGPGFDQYALTTLATFFAVQFAAPIAIAKWLPGRVNLPPRVAHPGSYPRP